MTDELRSAITSDKVETDNANFATVKADQTCETALLPRENAFRQRTWQVTLEKGAVYNPPEGAGIYGEEVEFKYGVQVNGDVFGRNGVDFEHGGAKHDAIEDGETIGTRVFGTVASEGTVEVSEPDSRLEDWSERPVTVYGDVVGKHVTFDEPTVVYGCVHADKTFRANAPTVVVGDVYSAGMIEASDLFAFSITANDDVTLGGNVAVVNPTIRSESGNIVITDEVGLLLPDVYEQIRDGNNLDAVGLWVFDVDAVWENVLVPADVFDHREGQAADRSWRTVNELEEEYYRGIREAFESSVRATRKDPPDIEEFRYAGVASVSEIGGETRIEGDVVAGTQEKTVENTDMTKIDQSTTEIDQSTEVHDESTTVEDSVVNRSDIGGDADEKDADGTEE